jgi:hypothetical protein
VTDPTFSGLRRFGAGALLVLIAGCGGDDGGEADGGGGGAAVAVWPEDFESAWPQVRDCRLSPAAHDGFSIRVFTNPEAEQAYADGDYPFAAGTVLVKGEYDDPDCTELVRVSAMERLDDGEDPERGDWRWLRTGPDGRELDGVEPRSCAGCHAACDSSDRACTEP